MLNIAKIKTINADDPAYIASTVKATVLDVSNIDKDAKNERFYAVLGDATGTITATIYNIDFYDKFKKEMGIFLIDVLLKQSYIGVTKRTQVAVSTPQHVPEEIREAAPKLPGASSDIASILVSPVKSLFTVRGIAVVGYMYINIEKVWV